VPITTSVDGIPTDLVDRLEGGGIEIDISNPFEIRGVFQVRISYDDGIMSRYADLAAGESMIEFDLSESEIRELLSSTSITVEFMGEVNSASGMVTLRPGQRIELVPRLFATLRVES
jgi:hypothetical protein